MTGLVFSKLFPFSNLYWMEIRLLFLVCFKLKRNVLIQTLYNGQLGTCKVNANKAVYFECSFVSHSQIYWI